jgi:hypothetical protein
MQRNKEPAIALSPNSFFKGPEVLRSLENSLFGRLEMQAIEDHESRFSAFAGNSKIEAKHGPKIGGAIG